MKENCVTTCQISTDIRVAINNYGNTYLVCSYIIILLYSNEMLRVHHIVFIILYEMSVRVFQI